MVSKAKMMYAFDHIPAASTTAGGNVPTYGGDYPFVLYGSYAGGTISDSGGMWLTNNGYTGSGSNYYTSAWLYPFSQYDLTKARSWFGFRLKMTTTARVLPILSVYDTTKTQQATLVLPTDFAFVTGQEHYVELMIDRVNRTRSVWVDNTLVVNAQSYGAWAISATDWLAMGNTGPGGAANPGVLQFKDIYVMDDPGDGSVTRLGIQLARALTIGTASGTGWTPSAGSVVSALNTAINTTTPSTPNVNAPGDGTPLQMALASAVDATASVNGVLLIAAGQRNAATGTVLRTTMTDQATPTPNQQALNPLQFPAGSYQYGKVLGFLPNALDGTSWTPTKTTQLSLSSVASAT